LGEIRLAFFIPNPVIYNGPLVGQPGFMQKPKYS
jgi:hypothetical protein